LTVEKMVGSKNVLLLAQTNFPFCSVILRCSNHSGSINESVPFFAPSTIEFQANGQIRSDLVEVCMVDTPAHQQRQDPKGI